MTVTRLQLWWVPKGDVARLRAILRVTQDLSGHSPDEAKAPDRLRLTVELALARCVAALGIDAITDCRACAASE